MTKSVLTLTPSRQVRNQIRGLLDRRIHEDRPRVFPSIIKKLYNTNDKESVRWTENQIRTNPNFSHVPLPVDFPMELDPYRGKILISMAHVGARLSTTLDRADRNKKALLAATKSISDINRAIFSFNANSAIDLINDHLDKFGFSHIILRKVIFLASTNLLEKRNEPLNSLLDRIEANKRDIIRPSLADAYSRKRQYLGVVWNVMNISSRSNLSELKKSIAQHTVRPICYNGKEFEGGLEAFANYSLLDSLYFVAAHFEFPEKIEFLNEHRITWQNFDAELRESLTCGDFSREALSSLYEGFDSEVEEDGGMEYYRHLSAFVEFPEASRLRALGDFYLTYEPETRVEPTFVAKLREAHFGKEIDWGDLVLARENIALPTNKYIPQSAGTLERTIAMAVYFATQKIPDEICADELITLMNYTTSADRVLSERAIKNLKELSSAQGDLLFMIIPLCLLAVDPKNSRDEFLLRRILQDLVVRDFGSDYVEFLKSMLDRAFQVGAYLYNISTDEFLIQFYHLFKESSEAVECRAQLHDLLYERTENRRFKDMASSLRLSAKIAKAREELDDSRIYVDLNRFDTWLKDNKLERILAIVRSGACQPETLEKISVSDVNSSQGNEAELLRDLGECYKEFCENRIFGIASYLGRRIRHGTLKGTLLQDLGRSIEERFEAFEYDDTCRRYFHHWKMDFENYIKKIGSDYFHIRSPQKPKGMISPEVSEGHKFQYLKKGGASIISAFGEYEDPDFFVRIISETCWQIASEDLNNAHRVLAVCKANARISEIPDNVATILGSAQKEYLRHVNSKLDEKFNLVATWFNRPKITVPSVDLPTLLRVVHREVSEEFTSYVEAITDDDETKIVLTGSSYHIVYDFLYVALKNAAEHGKPGGSVVMEVNVDVNGALIDRIKLTVKSEYRVGESAGDAQAGISACRLDKLDGAYVEEGKSGLRKIMRLERDWPEVSKVEITPSNQEFIVEMNLELNR